MPNWKKVQAHHGHARSAIVSKDHAKTMHHIGHMMAAMRQAPEQEGGEQLEPVVETQPAQTGLRARLSRFTKNL